jgi:hypothetical protein
MSVCLYVNESRRDLRRMHAAMRRGLRVPVLFFGATSVQSEHYLHSLHGCCDKDISDMAVFRVFVSSAFFTGS